MGTASPHINSLGVAATVQLEMIRAHGIDTTAATIAHARRGKHTSVHCVALMRFTEEG